MSAFNPPRTFKLDNPHQTGNDIGAWQSWLVDAYNKWEIKYPLVIDKDYGQATRAATMSFMHAWGVADAGEAMKSGLTPEWRSKLRHYDRSSAEQARFESEDLKEYRAKLRDRVSNLDVCYPVPNLITDDWGWHPGIHDGIDLICPPKQPLLAIVTGRVIRADADGWWGLGAPKDPALKAKGDGIIIIRATVDVGPIQRGMNFCYGHAEGAVVRDGERVRAGQHIGHAGLANAWHVHFMVNDNNDSRGVGDRDPKKFLDYAEDHS